MSNPVWQILNLGKAFTEVIGEKVQETFIETISEIEKVKAEQGEQLRQLLIEVEEKANQENRTNQPTQITIIDPTTDTQEVLDNLRAEIASLRSELKNWHINLQNPL